MPDLQTVLQALANPRRREILRVIGVKGCRPGELATQLSLSPQKASNHLHYLRHAGLVEERRLEPDSRTRLYTIRLASLDVLRDWLASIDATGLKEMMNPRQNGTASDDLRHDPRNKQHHGETTDGKGRCPSGDSRGK
ncbi:MAG: metalloregulator ArsR/SmtB family transcription factor [Pacificimonas sp.]